MDSDLFVILMKGHNLFYEDTPEEKKLMEKCLYISCCNITRNTHEKISGYTNLVHRYLPGDFKSHFRMSRCTMGHLAEIVATYLKPKITTVGRPPENPLLQCLIVVWVLANQESYRSIADRFNVSKSTIFQCIRRVCAALNKEAKNYIKWPKGLAALSIVQGFKCKSFPGVIGAIDGCHIEIKIGKDNTCAYLNRKGTTSIILQGVCDHNCNFTDIFVGFPGSVHDARVFSRSPVATYGDEFFPGDTHLLGDSAYPLGKHLLVPFKDNGHLSQSQKKFNTAHAATRVAIERTFGLLKGRWRRLKYLEIHATELIPQIVSAACVLHNFCYGYSDEVSNDISFENTSDSGQTYPDENVESYTRRDREGVHKRNQILNLF